MTPPPLKPCISSFEAENSGRNSVQSLVYGPWKPFMVGLMDLKSLEKAYQ